MFAFVFVQNVFNFSATLNGAPVAALTLSSVVSAAISINVKPESKSTSKTA